MKKPSTLLRSFSSRLSTRLAPSPAVAPWPPVRSAYDRWLAAELDELRADPLAPCTSAAWLARALTLAAASQRRLVAASDDTASAGAGIDWKTIDECVEDAAELLDACAALRDRLDALRSYATATRVALHWLEGHGAEAAARRAADAFAECEAVERRCGRGAELAKCGSNLCKLGERAVLSSRTPLACGHRSDGEEALSGVHVPAAPRGVRRRQPRCRRQGRGEVGVRAPGGAEARQGGVRPAEEGRRAVHVRARCRGGRRAGGEVRRRRRAALPGDSYGGSEQTVRRAGGDGGGVRGEGRRAAES
ncbi:hypothetical protein SEVIR_8G084400v4 [Setaria viridis]